MAEHFIPGATALVVVVPKAEAAVADLRRRFDPATRAGVPAHVTVLFPWLSKADIGEPELRLLTDLFTRLPAFEATLARVGRFPGVVYVAPEPADRFVALTRAVERRWPEAPPYGGRFMEVVPHLTVADGQTDAVLDEVAGEMSGRLPIAFGVDAVDLLTFDGCRWMGLQRFGLGSATAQV